MKYLKIQNNGELDIRLVALMGGTTKQNAKFKIGRFGTGLKYTMAYLYRNNIDFKCFSGLNEVKIHTEKELIGEQEFEIICINHNRTSITTQMGQDWTAWMIIRELWCNALDEGGNLKDVVNDDQATGEESKTTFYVQLTPEINEVLNNWGSYFIHDQTPMFENGEYAIYDSRIGDGTLKLYKQGVLIFQSPEKALFSYDIKAASINELREFKGVVSLDVLSALSSPNTDVINHFFANIKEDHYEGGHMDYDWYSTFGDVWSMAMGEQKIVSYETVRHIEQNGIDPEQIKNAIKLPKKVYSALSKAFEGCRLLRSAQNDKEFYEAKDPRIEEKINEAINYLFQSEYALHPDLKVVYGFFMDKDTKIGLSKRRKELMVSAACLTLTDREIAMQLIEKNEMYATNFGDCTRELQSHFIGLYAKTLLDENKVLAA